MKTVRTQAAHSKRVRRTMIEMCVTLFGKDGAAVNRLAELHEYQSGYVIYTDDHEAKFECVIVLTDRHGVADRFKVRALTTAEFHPTRGQRQNHLKKITTGEA